MEEQLRNCLVTGIDRAKRGSARSSERYASEPKDRHPVACTQVHFADGLQSPLHVRNGASAGAADSSRDDTMATAITDLGLVDFDMAALLSFSRNMPARGQTIEATVLSVSKAGAIVTFGSKSDAVVPAKHLGEEQLAPGQRVSFVVFRSAEVDDTVELTRLWHDLQRHCLAGKTVSVRITDVVKRSGCITGVRAKYKELSGFIPSSMLGNGTPLEKLIGTTVAVKVTDAEPQTNRLIFDRRRVQEEERMQSMKPGDVLNGTVRAIAKRDDGGEFGLFVEAGGASGLVHRSELPLSKDTSISERYAAGQPVQVLVLSIGERAHGRKSLSLSIKRLVRDRFLRGLQIGDTVNGIVAKQADYGFFIRLSEEGDVNGLLHRSQLPSAVRSGRRPLKVGDEVSVKVVSVDVSAGRIGLSMREQAQG